jgi:hypothetical protein
MFKYLTAGALLAMTSAVLPFVSQAAHAYTITGKNHQAEQRAGNRITVEESWIHIVVCNGAGEKGGQYYVYQYVKRNGFRAILPPNWGSPIGGRDFGSFAQAASAACHR